MFVGAGVGNAVEVAVSLACTAASIVAATVAEISDVGVGTGETLGVRTSVGVFPSPPAQAARTSAKARPTTMTNNADDRLRIAASSPNPLHCMAEDRLVVK